MFMLICIKAFDPEIFREMSFLGVDFKRLDNRVSNHSQNLDMILNMSQDDTDAGRCITEAGSREFVRIRGSYSFNPQPREAYRWIKQAKLDFDSAVQESCNERVSSPEWICFKCHQVNYFVTAINLLDLPYMHFLRRSLALMPLQSSCSCLFDWQKC